MLWGRTRARHGPCCPRPRPSTNPPVKYLSRVRPNQVPRSLPGLSALAGRARVGFAHRLAFVFLLLGRLVCLRGCFSPNTGRKRYQSAPERFRSGPGASSVPDTAWSSDGPVVKEVTCPHTHMGCGNAGTSVRAFCAGSVSLDTKLAQKGRTGSGRWGSVCLEKAGLRHVWVPRAPGWQPFFQGTQGQATQDRERCHPGRNLPQSGLWEHSPGDLTSELTPSPVGRRRPLLRLLRGPQRHAEPGRAQGTDSEWPKLTPQSGRVSSPQT